MSLDWRLVMCCLLLLLLSCGEELISTSGSGGRPPLVSVVDPKGALLADARVVLWPDEEVPFVTPRCLDGRDERPQRRPSSQGTLVYGTHLSRMAEEIGFPLFLSATSEEGYSTGLVRVESGDIVTASPRSRLVVEVLSCAGIALRRTEVAVCSAISDSATLSRQPLVESVEDGRLKEPQALFEVDAPSIVTVSARDLDTGQSGHATVAISPGEERRLAIRVGRHSASGRVVFPDDDSPPHVLARMLLADGKIVSARIRDDGSFRIPVPCGDSARLAVMPLGEFVQRSPTVNLDESGVLIEMERGVTYRCRIVSGTGAAVDGMSIRAYPVRLSTDDIAFASCITSNWCTVPLDGRVSLGPLVAGREYVLGIAGGDRTHPSLSFVAGESNDEAVIDIDALSHPELVGRVLSDETNAGVAARVAVTAVGQAPFVPSVVTSDSGLFVLELRKNSTYFVEASASGYGASRKRIEVGEGPAPSIELRLQRAGEIIVRVVTSGSVAQLERGEELVEIVAFPKVLEIQQDATPVRGDRSNGEWVFRSLAAGDYKLAAISDAGQVLGVATATVSVGGQCRTLMPIAGQAGGAELTVACRNEVGDDAAVYVRSLLSQQPASVDVRIEPLGAERTATFLDLPASIYAVTIHEAGAETAEVRVVELASGDERVVVFD